MDIWVLRNKKPLGVTAQPCRQQTKLCNYFWKSHSFQLNLNDFETENDRIKVNFKISGSFLTSFFPATSVILLSNLMMHSQFITSADTSPNKPSLIILQQGYSIMYSTSSPHHRDRLVLVRPPVIIQTGLPRIQGGLLQHGRKESKALPNCEIISKKKHEIWWFLLTVWLCNYFLFWSQIFFLDVEI